jgi:spore maturation protein CgeB
VDHLHRNLLVLAQRQPELAARLENTPPSPQAEVLPSRTGPPALRLGRRWLTSSVDPVAEGRRLAQQAPDGPLVAFGFGLGYHLEPLADRDLVVWEPDAGLLRLALASRDLTRLLSRVRLGTTLEELGELGGRSLYLLRSYARLRPAQAEALARRLEADSPDQARPPRPASPRVLVVPPVLGGSLPVAWWCAEALEELGCRVRTLPLEKIAPLYDLIRRSPLGEDRLDRVRAPMISFLGELALMAAEEFAPHLVLVLAQAPLSVPYIRALRRTGAVVAFWFIENYRHMTYFREVAGAYDYFFHIQGEELAAELEALGANHAFLPMAAHPPVHRPLELSAEERLRWGAPVGFMGCGYPNRVRIFSHLVERGLRLRIWGTSWPRQGPLAPLVAEGGRRLSSQEVVKVYNACAVVVNLHSSPEPTDGVASQDFVNPRTLEVPACGGFQLVDRVRGLEELLRPGREVAVFTREEELVEMAHHYLAHPDQRQRIAAAGYRRVLAEHTYYHRMERLLTHTLGPAAEDRPPAEAPAAALELLAALASQTPGREA